ncbi:MAG: hypothetical protein AAGA90_17000 [Actinomycetota bacterium]
MEHTTNRRRITPTRALFAIAIAVAVLLGMLAPASAGRKIDISGDAVPSLCNDGEGVGAIELTGDLDGCLTFFPKRASCTEYNGFALYEERGRETFVGTFRGEEGTFRTRYTLAATYTAGSCVAIDAALAGEGDFPFERQLTGGCDHQIIGKRGAFDDLDGLITFYDVIPEPGVSGASNYFYSGYLR